MAKDPKNFTGEDVPALLKHEADRRREVEDWKGMLMSFALFAGLLALLYIFGSWLAELFH